MNDLSDLIASVPPHVPRNLVVNFQEGEDPDFATDPYGVFRRLAKAAPPSFTR
jgi:hypothetical protein